MDIQKEIIPEFKQLTFIKKIILFGSRVDNPGKEKGDVDLCFVIEETGNTDIIFEKISKFILEQKILIHPIILSQTEFKKKMKIQIYKKSILKKGKILYSKK